MSGDGTQQRLEGELVPIVDEYGTVEQHVGTCKTCGRVVTDDGSYRGFETVHDELSGHVDDGTACHDFRIMAEYEGGGDRRVS